MFNHASPYKAHWTFDNRRDGFGMTADDDIAINEEIYDSYGTKSNYRFFLHYAFIYMDENGENEKNEFPMTIDLDEKDKYYSVKKANFLDHDPYTYKEYKLVQNFDAEVMSEFLAYSRLIAFDGDSAELIEASKVALDLATEEAEAAEAEGLSEYVYKVFKNPHDLQNEIATWKFIRSKVIAALEKYPTTLADDLYLLHEDEQEQFLTYNKRNCILIRVNDK